MAERSLGPQIEDVLLPFGMVYIATPYSKCPHGIPVAFYDACIITARLLRHGVKVFSPIVHTHPLAVYGKIDPYDHSIWLPLDEVMMARSDTMALARLPGWESSVGIAHESDFFTRAGKPIFHFDPVTFECVASSLT
jgi:hypothetical protein